MRIYCCKLFFFFFFFIITRVWLFPNRKSLIKGGWRHIGTSECRNKSLKVFFFYFFSSFRLFSLRRFWAVFLTNYENHPTFGTTGNLPLLPLLLATSSSIIFLITFKRFICNMVYYNYLLTTTTTTTTTSTTNKKQSEVAGSNLAF